MKLSKLPKALLTVTLSSALLFSSGGIAHAAEDPALCDLEESTVDSLNLNQPRTIQASEVEQFSDDLERFDARVFEASRSFASAIEQANIPVRHLTLLTNEDTMLGWYYMYKEQLRVPLERMLSQGYGSPTDLKEVLSIHYNFVYSFQNAFTQAYNDDQAYTDLAINGGGIDSNSMFASITQLFFSLPELGEFSSYQQLGSAYIDEAELQPAFQRLQQELTALGQSPAEVASNTHERVRESLLRWIKTIDLDYITAYQAQTLQYLAEADTAGYVMRAGSDEAVLTTGQPDERPLKLADLGDRVP
jgi:hypothetical protein